MATNIAFKGTKRFEFRRKLGAGSMGVVYQVYDHERRQEVALKTLQRVDSANLLRFKNEFRALHDINHANLGSLHELHEDDGMWFFTMELVQGEDFMAYVRANETSARTDVDMTGMNSVGGLPSLAGLTGMTEAQLDETRTLGDLLNVSQTDLEAAQSVTQSNVFPSALISGKIEYDEDRLRESLKQLALGIAALHAAGKVHRDIKPSNIMVTPKGRVVLLDFGLVADTAAVRDSSPDRVVGTAAYMAPESVSGKPAGPASDWYAFGVVLYKALVGVVPHTAPSVAELLVRKQKVPAAPPRQHVKGLPEDLDSLCVELLRRDPADRPRVQEILRQLGVAPSEYQLEGDSTDASLTSIMPFVGRSEELAALDEAFTSSRKRPTIVVVHGDSGVGKSQLVEEFTKRLRPVHPETVLLSGRCYERESVAYKGLDGIADSLSAYMSMLPKHAATALLPVEAGRLAKLFPVLGGVEAIIEAPQEEDLANPHEQRLRMFSALRELFVRLAKRAPLILYIDDLQWIAADSIALLQEMLGHRDAPSLLLVATMRPTTDTERSRLLSSLDRIADTRHIDLDVLPPEQAAELARQLLPTGGDANFSRIAQEAAGHPLFIQELARNAASDSASTAGLSLDETLWARIKRLPVEERRLLEVVCVAGSPLAQEICASAAEMDPVTRVRATRALRAGHLVRTDGVRASDTIVAYHDRARETVTNNLDAEQKRFVHQRIAVSLERAGAAKSDPQRLVRHAEAAGDHRRAAAHARAAAQHAIEAMAFDQAAEFFRTALRLREYDEAETRTLRLACASALVNAGRGAEAAEEYVAAAQGADANVRLDCQRRATEQWLTAGHLEQGLAAVSELLGHVDVSLPATPRSALFSLLWQRTKLRFRGLGWKRREISEIPASDLTRLDVYKAVSHGLGMVDPVRGMDFQSRGLVLALRTGESFRVARNLFLEASFVASQGKPKSLARGRALVERASKIDSEDPRLTPWKQIAEGCVAYFGSDYRASAEHLRQAEALWRDQLGVAWEIGSARMFLMWSLLRGGGVGAMGQLLDQYLRDASRRGDLYNATTLIRSCHVRWLADDTVEVAKHMLEDALWSPPEGRFHLQHWFAFKAAREMDLYTGAPTELGLFIGDFGRLGRSMLTRVITVRSDARWLRGRLAIAAAAHPEYGAEMMKEAAESARLLEREREPYAGAAAHLLRSAHACQTGDTERTVALLKAAVIATEKDHMLLHTACARRRQGEIVGGDEGAALIAKADAWMAEQGIKNPERFAELVAPGFSERKPIALLSAPSGQ